MIYLTRKPLNLYIGSSTNLWRRLKAHYNQSKTKSIQNKHPKLYNHISKYGINAYSYRVIEVCSNEKLLEREQYWIDKAFEDIYISKHILNILRKTGSTQGYRHTEEAKKKNLR